LNQNGSIKIHLRQLLKESGFCKNKFYQKAESQRSQLIGYINKAITRLDTEVLVRICITLNCSIADLLEYIPPDTQ
jgi:putative transcriptional regulator